MEGSFSAVSPPTFTTKYLEYFFSHFSRSTVAPIGGEKSGGTFLPPEKKEHLEDRGALAAEVATNAWPSVNLRSTFGIFPSHLGPIFADFAEFFYEEKKKKKKTRTCISEMVCFPIRKRDFWVRALPGSLLGGAGEKKRKRKPNVSTRFKSLCTAPGFKNTVNMSSSSFF